MKLHRSGAAGVNTFTGYGEGYVLVNGERHESSVIVLRDRVCAWDVAEFAALAEEHFAQLAAMQLEVVLLGTGPRLRFPPPQLTAPLARANIGLEVMDLQAACRTYNILVAEERKVAAALLFA
ncbi:MAG: hypothetical protein A3D95_02870 [Betaproteobacteria bacterium RIFCSPHIGHO2_12_FULL_69_13]|nr:MAG: hypothetical protein A3D95_02870 [Betaproteobacteria bacterium RIFCSPHIGHO2_12_FULL_69_13]OGA67630.1 MAG: hypothetical protein A3G83_04145 [Betaproteobacteria bacterium RIFCSPLOWO2_12_FULL_68_20]